MLMHTAKWLSGMGVALLLLIAYSPAQATILEDFGYVDANDIDVDAVGVTLGATAYSGFGKSVNMVVGEGNILGAVSQPITQSQLQGTNGAFTYEALIKVGGINPLESQCIMAMGPTASGSGGQSFQFRIGSGGMLQFIEVEPSVQVVEAAIPTSGANAWSADHWYHVAASYTGSEGTSGNTSLYWTRLGDDVTTANLLGTGTLSSDISSGVQHQFTIGNRFTQNGEDSLAGLIDEVRISDIARGAGGFIFSSSGAPSPYTADANTLHLWTADVPEPASMLMLSTALIGLLAYAWRKRK